uniref:Fibronectin type III domain protein n=1 Tax=Geobacter sp. (strain M21) TaxID=443144 RepID=C6DYH9_GEOSM
MDSISNLTDAQVVPLTTQLMAVLTKNPSLYGRVMGVYPTWEELKELHESHIATLNDPSSGEPEKVRENQAKRQLLNRKFGAFHSAVKLAAADDPSLLTTFGFSQPKPRKSPSVSNVSRSEKLKAVHGDNSGEIFLKGAPVKYARSYDIDYCEGDPSLEGSWKHHSVVAHASKMKVTGLTPGRVYWFRVRGIGANGPGPWSPYASLMAI